MKNNSPGDNEISGSFVYSPRKVGVIKRSFFKKKISNIDLAGLRGLLSVEKGRKGNSGWVSRS